MNDNDVKISAAKEADIPEILELVRELAVYEKLTHLLVATEAGYWECLFGKHPVAEALMARKGKEAVGYAIFFRNFSTFLGKPGIYLEDIFVLPSHRGKGIGKKMLATVAAIAQERGCGRLEWSVLDWNTPSIDFYRSLGAEPLDGWTIFRMTEDTIAKLAEHGDRLP
jgi:GNAT superfamily N-acetyltransferase